LAEEVRGTWINQTVIGAYFSTFSLSIEGKGKYRYDRNKGADFRWLPGLGGDCGEWMPLDALTGIGKMPTPGFFMCNNLLTRITH
jgi:hypothetical protein